MNKVVIIIKITGKTLLLEYEILFFFFFLSFLQCRPSCLMHLSVQKSKQEVIFRKKMMENNLSVFLLLKPFTVLHLMNNTEIPEHCDRR